METSIGTLRADFQAKVDRSLVNIKSIEDFRKSDVMVDYVLGIGSKLFTKPLDQHFPPELVRIGGKLTGAYSYLSQKWGRAKAEAVAYRQHYDEMVASSSLRNYKLTQKITHARAEAKVELSEVAAMVLGKEAECHNFEHIVSATERMIGFIQSAIKVKEGERFSSNQDKKHGEAN